MRTDEASRLSETQIRLEYDLLDPSRYRWRDEGTQRARIVVYQFTGGTRVYFHHDLNRPIIDQVLAFDVDTLLNSWDVVRRVLPGNSIETRVWRGCSYVFSPSFNFSSLQHPVLVDEKICVWKRSEPVACAYSARQNTEAAEIIVETKERFRRRGYGKLVASVWARQIMSSGRTAFYSHVADNDASRHLAKSLNVEPFAEIAAYD